MKETYKLQEQERPLKILNCFTRHRKVIKLFDNYYAIVSEVKHKSFHGKGLKILTRNQVL